MDYHCVLTPKTAPIPIRITRPPAAIPMMAPNDSGQEPQSAGHVLHDSSSSLSQIALPHSENNIMYIH